MTKLTGGALALVGVLLLITQITTALPSPLLVLAGVAAVFGGGLMVCDAHTEA